MKFTPRKLISILFYAAAFLPPLVLYKYTSELFEFNKIIIVYALTVLITSLWVARMILEKRVIFTRTSLDIPLVVFLISLGISTLLSIDINTSIYGYPSRFHGGILSWISYSILYWAFVSSLEKKEVKSFIYVLLFSGFLVGTYGILQRFGIDDQVWEQDVKTRVFSTLGQPNWLAAWITPLIIISLSLIIKNFDRNKRRFVIYNFLFTVFVACLLYTRSRSGILSLAAAGLVFALFILVKRIKFKINSKRVATALIYPAIAAFILALVIGTPWSNSFLEKPKEASSELSREAEATSDITASEDIRKIVWKGAVDVWRDYPLFGSGVETFAYSYYEKRPIEHNYVSEWDFLYNKAHNEYLNTLSTTGLFGLLSYLILSFFAFFIPAKSAFLDKNNFLINSALASSLVSIVITNFFGFLVVPVALLFILLPAISIAINKKEKKAAQEKANNLSIILLSITGIISAYLLFSVYNYWQADILYTKGKTLNSYGNFVDAQKALTNAINKNPNQPFYYAELAQSSMAMALSLEEAGNEDKAIEFAQIAESQALYAANMNSNNPNMYRVYAGLMTNLSQIDPTYLNNAKDAYLIGENLAPTDPKMKYRLGITMVRLGMVDEGIAKIKESIELKNDYIDARYALAQTYTEIEEDEKAREELNFILENITPNNAAVESLLQSLDED